MTHYLLTYLVYCGLNACVPLPPIPVAILTPKIMDMRDSLPLGPICEEGASPHTESAGALTLGFPG